MDNVNDLSRRIRSINSETMQTRQKLSTDKEIEITLADGMLTVRPLPDAERAARVLAATDDVFARRADALRRLGYV